MSNNINGMSDEKLAMYEARNEIYLKKHSYLLKMIRFNMPKAIYIMNSMDFDSRLGKLLTLLDTGGLDISKRRNKRFFNYFIEDLRYIRNLNKTKEEKREDSISSVLD